MTHAAYVYDIEHVIVDNLQFMTSYVRYSFIVCLDKPNANMADHSVGTRDELHESEASEASVFCFYNASPEKSCLVDGLV